MSNNLALYIGLSLPIAGALILFWLNCRTYKEIDGKPYVRHWRFGKWENLADHINNEHEYDR